MVVPVFGVEEFLPQCIESLLEQIYENLEIILVDDGSVDASGDICDEFSRLDHRVSVIHKPNGGLVSARQAGAEAATGCFLGFVDGDDWVAPGFFESLHAQAVAAEADLVIAGHVREFLGKHEIFTPRIAAGVYDCHRIRDEILPLAIYNGTFFQHGVSTYVWNKLFKSEAALPLIRAIPPAIVMGEDAALVYPYLANSSTLVISEVAEYYYRQRPHSIVKSVPDLGVEYSRLGALFGYLKDQLSGLPPHIGIDTQLRRYFEAQVLMRSGGVLPPGDCGEWYSPFRGLNPGSRVVVYSTGSFGQLLVSSLERLGTVHVVGWVDEDLEESQRLGLRVTPLTSIANLEFDLLLIAAIDSNYAASLLPILEGLGVNRDRVVSVMPDFDLLERRLVEMGFDMGSYEFEPPTFAGRTPDARG